MTTLCRARLGTARQCELPGDHAGPHRSGDLAWARNEHMPRWFSRVSDMPHGFAKALDGAAK